MKDWYSFYKRIKEIYGDEPEQGLIEYIDLVEKGKVLDMDQRGKHYHNQIEYIGIK